MMSILIRHVDEKNDEKKMSWNYRTMKPEGMIHADSAASWDVFHSWGFSQTETRCAADDCRGLGVTELGKLL